MRRQHRRTSGVSVGTVMILTLLGLIVGGCVLLFPSLIGDIELRIDPQKIGVALDSTLRSERTDNAAEQTTLPETTPATAPPLDMASFAPATTPAVTRSLSLTATGSIKVDTQIQKTCTGADGYTFGPVFEQLRESFASEINLATLENLTVVNEKLTDVNMPVDALTAIHDAGINVVCNGFYGALNNGVKGLATTMAAIVQSGMTPYGIYTSAENRQHVTTLQAQDVTIALLSFQSELSAAGQKKTTAAEQDFVIAQLTVPTIAADITTARAAGAQIVVVSLCWGKEGVTVPSNTQKEMAQAIANAGADIILGTHSGTLQPVSLLTATRADGTTHQTLCAYSLGNLLESDRSDRDAISGALLHINMTYNLGTDQLSFDSLTYTPTYVWRGKIDGKTAYRVLRSNAEPPEFVDSDQRNVMGRCLTLVRNALASSPVTEAK